MTSGIGKISVIALTVMALAVGLCLLHGDALGMSDHAMFPHLCGWLFVLPVVPILLRLSEVGRLPAESLRSVYSASLHRIDPPPKRFRFA